MRYVNKKEEQKKNNEDTLILDRTNTQFINNRTIFESKFRAFSMLVLDHESSQTNLEGANFQLYRQEFLTWLKMSKTFSEDSIIDDCLEEINQKVLHIHDLSSFIQNSKMDEFVDKELKPLIFKYLEENDFLQKELFELNIRLKRPRSNVEILRTQISNVESSIKKNSEMIIYDCQMSIYKFIKKSSRENIKKIIHFLNNNGEVVLEGGYSSFKSKQKSVVGHSVKYKIKKGQVGGYTLIVFNTGEGCEKSEKNGIELATSRAEYKIPSELKLKTILLNLVDMRINKSQIVEVFEEALDKADKSSAEYLNSFITKEANKCTGYFIEEIIKESDGKKIKEEEAKESSLSLFGQMSGSCVARSLNAYLKDEINDLEKEREIRIRLKISSLIDTYESLKKNIGFIDVKNIIQYYNFLQMGASDILKYYAHLKIDTKNALKEKICRLKEINRNINLEKKNIGVVRLEKIIAKRKKRIYNINVDLIDLHEEKLSDKISLKEIINSNNTSFDSLVKNIAKIVTSNVIDDIRKKILLTKLIDDYAKKIKCENTYLKFSMGDLLSSLSGITATADYRKNPVYLFKKAIRTKIGGIQDDIFEKTFRDFYQLLIIHNTLNEDKTIYSAKYLNFEKIFLENAKNKNFELLTLEEISKHNHNNQLEKREDFKCDRIIKSIFDSINNPEISKHIVDIFVKEAKGNISEDCKKRFFECLTRIAGYKDDLLSFFDRLVRQKDLINRELNVYSDEYIIINNKLAMMFVKESQYFFRKFKNSFNLNLRHVNTLDLSSSFWVYPPQPLLQKPIDVDSGDSSDDCQAKISNKFYDYLYLTKKPCYTNYQYLEDYFMEEYHQDINRQKYKFTKIDERYVNAFNKDLTSDVGVLNLLKSRDVYEGRTEPKIIRAQLLSLLARQKNEVAAINLINALSSKPDVFISKAGFSMILPSLYQTDESGNALIQYICENNVLIEVLIRKLKLQYYQSSNSEKTLILDLVSRLAAYQSVNKISFNYNIAKLIKEEYISEPKNELDKLVKLRIDILRLEDNSSIEIISKLLESVDVLKVPLEMKRELTNILQSRFINLANKILYYYTSELGYRVTDDTRHDDEGVYVLIKDSKTFVFSIDSLSLKEFGESGVYHCVCKDNAENYAKEFFKNYLFNDENFDFSLKEDYSNLRITSKNSDPKAEIILSINSFGATGGLLTITSNNFVSKFEILNDFNKQKLNEYSHSLINLFKSIYPGAMIAFNGEGIALFDSNFAKILTIDLNNEVIIEDNYKDIIPEIEHIKHHKWVNFFEKIDEKCLLVKYPRDNSLKLILPTSDLDIRVGIDGDKAWINYKGKELYIHEEQNITEKSIIVYDNQHNKFKIFLDIPYTTKIDDSISFTFKQEVLNPYCSESEIDTKNEIDKDKQVITNFQKFLDSRERSLINTVKIAFDKDGELVPDSSEQAFFLMRKYFFTNDLHKSMEMMWKFNSFKGESLNPNVYAWVVEMLVTLLNTKNGNNNLSYFDRSSSSHITLLANLLVINSKYVVSANQAFIDKVLQSNNPVVQHMFPDESSITKSLSFDQNKLYMKSSLTEDYLKVSQRLDFNKKLALNESEVGLLSSFGFAHEFSKHRKIDMPVNRRQVVTNKLFDLSLNEVFQVSKSLPTPKIIKVMSELDIGKTENDRLKAEIEIASENSALSDINDAALVEFANQNSLGSYVANLNGLLKDKDPVNKKEKLLSFCQKLQQEHSEINPLIDASHIPPVTFNILMKYFLQDAINDVCELLGVCVSTAKNIFNSIEEILSLQVLTQRVSLINALYGEHLERLQDNQITLNLCKQIRDLKSNYDFKDVSNRELLVLEAYCGFRLTMTQVETLKDLSISQQNKIAQVIMGGGKTSVILPILATKNASKNLSIIIVPESLVLTNANDLTLTTHKLFQSNSRVFKFDSNNKGNVDYLKLIISFLNDTEESKDYIVTTKEDLQMVEICFIDIVTNGKDTSPDLIDLYRTILNKLKNSISVIDEVDTVLDIDKEFNLSYGDKNHIPREIVSDTLFIYNIIGYGKDSFKKDKRLNFNEIKCKIARLKIWKEAGLNEDLVLKYLNNDDASFEEINSLRDGLLKDRLNNFRTQLNSVLSKTLDFDFRVDYGLPSANSKNPYIAVPYKSNNTPDEGSYFSSSIETLNLTIQTIMSLPNDSAIILEVTQKVLKEMAKRFKMLDINGKKKLFKQLKPCFNLSDENYINDMTKLLFSEDDKYDVTNFLALKFLVLSEYICPKIENNKHKIITNPIDFINQLGLVAGVSGTLASSSSFEKSMQQKIAFDVVDGKTASLILSKKPKINHLKINKIRLDDIESFLHQHLLNKSIRAIIDIGALFFGMSNKEVSEKIKQYLKSGNDYNHIKYIIFYDGNNALQALSVQTGIVTRLEYSEINYVNKTLDCHPDERFTFYDQAHCTGSDIRQSPDATAIATISKNTTLKDLLQGTMRMRGFNAEQSVIYVTSAEVAEKVNSPKHLIDFCLNNEIQKNHSMALSATIKNIQGVAREQILRVLRDKDVKISEIELNNPRFKKYFFQDNMNDVSSYSAVYQYVDTQELLNRLENEVLGDIKSVLENFGDRFNQLLEDSKDKVGEIKRNAMQHLPERLQVVKEGSKFSYNTACIDKSQTSKKIAIQKQLQSQINKEVEFEAEAQKRVQVEERGDKSINWMNISKDITIEEEQANKYSFATYIDKFTQQSLSIRGIHIKFSTALIPLFEKLISPRFLDEWILKILLGETNYIEKLKNLFFEGVITKGVINKMLDNICRNLSNKDYNDNLKNINLLENEIDGWRDLEKGVGVFNILYLSVTRPDAILVMIKDTINSTINHIVMPKKDLDQLIDKRSKEENSNYIIEFCSTRMDVFTRIPEMKVSEKSNVINDLMQKEIKGQFCLLNKDFNAFFEDESLGVALVKLPTDELKDYIHYCFTSNHELNPERETLVINKLCEIQQKYSVISDSADLSIKDVSFCEITENINTERKVEDEEKCSASFNFCNSDKKIMMFSQSDRDVDIEMKTDDYNKTLPFVTTHP